MKGWEKQSERERKSAFFFSLLGTDERRAAAIWCRHEKIHEGIVSRLWCYALNLLPSIADNPLIGLCEKRKKKKTQNVRFVARKVSQKRGGQKEEKVQVMAESLLPFLLLLVPLLLPPLRETDSGSPLLLFCKALKPLPVSLAVSTAFFLIWCLAWSEFIGFLKQEAFFFNFFFTMCYLSKHKQHILI